MQCADTADMIGVFVRRNKCVAVAYVVAITANRAIALHALMPASNRIRVPLLRTKTQLPELPDCKVMTSMQAV